MNNRHILIIGAGSAGRRHARNLRHLGAAVAAFDPRADRCRELAAEGDTLETYTDFSQALAGSPWGGCVIASPPPFHVEQIFEFARARPGVKIYCEKPLGISAEECRPLRTLGKDILLGYTYRWWEPIGEMRRRLRAGEIGKLRNARFTMSAHLADWHPWEPYQDFFMANKEQGGGALLDESHFIDLALWMFGGARSVYAQVDKISDLEIDADDNVDILLTTRDQVRVHLHLDLIGRPHERSIVAIGEGGTLAYSYEENRLRQSSTPDRTWNDHTFGCERNEMFTAAMREYLAWLEEGTPLPRCTVEDGLAALEVVDACRESSERGVRIRFE